MGPVIQLCRRCGFEIPADADECPQCVGNGAQIPSLAARQVAGLALRTRSVRRLPTTRPQRDPQPRPVPPAAGARTAFSLTAVLALVAVLWALLAWVVRQDRYITAVPHGTAEWFDTLAVVALLGAVIGYAIGLAAMAVWCIRWVANAIARRQRDRVRV